MRALLRLAGLFFDDGGQRHQFERRAERQAAGAARPDLVDQLALILLHLGEELGARIAARDLIGLGQQRALLRRLQYIPGQYLALAQALRDLLAGQPFGNGHRVQQLAPADKFVHDFLQGDGLLE